MNQPVRDLGSFRDPCGYVFRDGRRIVRAVMPRAADSFADVHDSGILKTLSDAGLMLPTLRIAASAEELALYPGARGETAAALYEHPRVPLISYPYEWVFSQLKEAALAHLDAQILALEEGFVFSDATAYNMQFVDGRAVHIDAMSVRRYREGEAWGGYNQFCRQYLLPLLIEAWAGVGFQRLYRGSMAGIAFEDALAILPRRKLMTSMSGFLHVWMHGRAVIKESSNIGRDRAQAAKLPKARYGAILQQMRGFVAGLDSAKRPASYWKTYAAANSYSDGMRDTKLAFVRDWAGAARPGTVWDIGGNTGDFSLAALEAGAERAVILDADADSLEAAWRTRTKKGHKGLMPLYMDLGDPSPDMGWQQRERKGLGARAGGADGMIALAVIHHMCIAGNLPLEEVVDWFLSLAPTGVIEFVPKQDPMVQGLLEVREDVFDDYTTERCRALIAAKATITSEHVFEENGRTLFAWTKR